MGAFPGPVKAGNRRAPVGRGRVWRDQALAVSGLLLSELTPAILLDSCELPQPFHGDPADQLIVASARHHGAALVTADRRLRGYRHVQTIW